MSEEFRREYLGEFVPTISREAHMAAEEYHEKCDAYDAVVCSAISKRTGDSMPSTPQESRLINKHAAYIFCNLSIKYKLGGEELQKAIHRIAR